MKLKKLFVAPNQPENELYLDVEFTLPNGKYQHDSVWIKDFIGDTPGDLADSLQIWVDHFRQIHRDKEEGSK